MLLELLNIHHSFLCARGLIYESFNSCSASDDELLGCGGTLLRRTSEGNVVG